MRAFQSTDSLLSPLNGDKTSDEVDVRVPCRLGAGGWQQDIHTKVVFAAVALTGFFSGEGAAVFSSEISLATPALGR